MRNLRRLAIAATVVAVGLSASAGAAYAFGQLLRTENATVKRAVTASSPLARGTTIRAAVEIQVAPGMHVNANPPSYEWLIPVELTIKGSEDVRVATTFYPEAIHKKFPYDEKPYAVYEDVFVVGLELEVSEDATLGEQPVQIVLDYQACNDEACFAPSKATLDLPLTIAAVGALITSSDSPLLKQAPFPER